MDDDQEKEEKGRRLVALCVCVCVCVDGAWIDVPLCKTFLPFLSFALLQQEEGDDRLTEMNPHTHTHTHKLPLLQSFLKRNERFFLSFPFKQVILHHQPAVDYGCAPSSNNPTRRIIHGRVCFLFF